MLEAQLLGSSGFLEDVAVGVKSISASVAEEVAAGESAEREAAGSIGAQSSSSTFQPSSSFSWTSALNDNWT